MLAKGLARALTKVLAAVSIGGLVGACGGPPSPTPYPATSGLDLVPKVFSAQPGEGSFELSDPVRIVVDGDDERLGEIALFLAEVIQGRSGFAVDIIPDRPHEPAILLSIGLEDENPEAFALTSGPQGVVIHGASAAGLFWGVQTLRQVLPPQFEDPAGERPDRWLLPALSIRDSPHFRWRGSLMDVSRHFFPVDFVKRYIDLLSRFKMNVLHWHLTEDQGWRLAIDRYPRLTEVGAWRTESDGSRYGGFYSKDEVREIIEYARIREVMIVPEIEMPGHATAALVAYPELGCAEPPIDVPSDWGVFPDIYCAGNPETFVFLENVLTEVAELFPSPYIHIGGDEVPKGRWAECESCQALMQRQGLEDEDALQAWFIQRIGEFLAGLGKTLVGWDEILDGGGVEGSIVQVWRSQETTKEAVSRGHQVIVSPTSHAYLDYSPAALPLERVYSLDPVVGLSDRERTLVLGGEANLWSEYITTANFDLQAFPRLLAMSEVLWSRGELDFDDFQSRLESDTYPRLRAMGVRIGPPASDVISLTVGTDEASGEPRVRVETSVEGLEVRYATDGTLPDGSSPLVSPATVFEVGDQVVLGVFAAEGALPIRREFSVLDHLARGKPITLQHPPDGRYPGPNLSALTDGLVGSPDHRDGTAQGWWEHDLVARIDLGQLTRIAAVSSSFNRNMGAWIAPPSEVLVEFSEDGSQWFDWSDGGEWEGNYSSAAAESRVASWVLQCDVEARFIRFTARQSRLPSDHPGAGHAAWLFAHEIVVR